MSILIKAFSFQGFQSLNVYSKSTLTGISINRWHQMVHPSDEEQA